MQRRDGLEAKFKLLSALPYDKRAKRKHVLVFGFVLDWYHSKYGDALASVRHIVTELKSRDPAGIGLYTGDVHAALTDLVDWGFLEQEKGSGRRASRYVPAWGKLDSVRENPNTKEAVPSVRETPNASVRETPNATGDSVRETPNEDPSTLIRSTDPDTGRDEVDFAPPVAGLAAAPVAKDGFEELYAAYGVRADWADARRVYERIAPSPALHAEMIEAAAAWRKAAGGIERMRLRRWLEEGRYHEDPKGERKTAPKEAPKPPLQTVISEPVPDNDNRVPYRRETFTITGASHETDDGSCYLDLVLRPEDGGEDVNMTICVESIDAAQQERGQLHMHRIARAAGLETFDDATDFIGARFVRVLPSKFSDWQYESAWTPNTSAPRLPSMTKKPWERPLVVNPPAEPGTVDWSKYHGDDEEDVA